jgi:hypothetical protein
VINITVRYQLAGVATCRVAWTLSRRRYATIDSSTERVETEREELEMTYMIVVTAAGLMGFTVDWAQRRCERWAFDRDKEL